MSASSTRFTPSARTVSRVSTSAGAPYPPLTKHTFACPRTAMQRESAIKQGRCSQCSASAGFPMETAAPCPFQTARSFPAAAVPGPGRALAMCFCAKLTALVASPGIVHPIASAPFPRHCTIFLRAPPPFCRLDARAGLWYHKCGGSARSSKKAGDSHALHHPSGGKKARLCAVV